MTPPIAKQHLKMARTHPEHVPKATLDRLAKLKAKHVALVSAAGERRTTPSGRALGLLSRPKPDAPTG
jgi:hypothetical protein